jgi:short-subunit dehydrogenase
LTHDAKTFAVNLLGAVSTIEVVLPSMLAAKRGHIVVLSSIADDLPSAEAPAYAASKAGLSAYLRGLALGLRPRGVYVTNVRFGFVATKMAKSPIKPFIISPQRAAQVIEECLRSRTIQRTCPRHVGALVRLLRWMQSARAWFS